MSDDTAALRPVRYWRWSTGEEPLDARSVGDVLDFRRQAAPQHYGELTARQAALREQCERLFRLYPDLSPSQIHDSAWRAIDRIMEDYGIGRHGD